MTGIEPQPGGDVVAASMPPWRIGIDVGGTFTDVVLIDDSGRLASIKSPSRPHDPGEGVIAALGLIAQSLGLSTRDLLRGCALLVHGSTVATNTLLERTGARVGVLTTEGFRDSLEIRRGIRTNPWDHRTPYPPVLAPRYLRLPVVGRIDRHGGEHTPLDETSVARALDVFAAENVESIAVCLINSYLNPIHERRVAELLRTERPDIPISVSSELAPVAGEYERLSTTVVDAYVAPRLVTYLVGLAEQLATLGLSHPMLLVKNNGGTATVDEVVAEPVTQTLSGPAAAVGALGYFGDVLGNKNLISVEVGGTSCDVVMMVDGEVTVTDRLTIGDYDTLLPAVDVHTVGAGGGAVAGVDRAGVLFAGPRGAGAVPGPASYGKGGEDPTVTDAQLVLGRLRAGAYAGGALTLDGDLAIRAVMEKVAEPLDLSLLDAAAGIIRVAEQRMFHAVSFVSIQRGIDPRGFTLVAGGGAGGLHGAALGRMLGCRAVYVPRLGGVLCALGMLNADVRHDYVRSFLTPLGSVAADEIGTRFDAMLLEATAALSREGFEEEKMRFEQDLDLRYQNQQWDVRVRLDNGKLLDPNAVRAEFEEEYERLYGHRQPETQVEIVKLRLTGFGVLPALPAPRERAMTPTAPTTVEIRPVYLDAERGMGEASVYAGNDLFPGHELSGPLVVEEETTTIFAGPDDRLKIDLAGNYLVHLGEQKDAQC
ncbi:MAG: hydantoinase/oxoprolinase family protein [Pseudomonadota bacterium]|nr:hydantoinase/oxoprolinase family protein [Pseudomonadota bacterium]